MWISPKIVDWFSGLKADADLNASVAKEAFQHLREDLAAVRAERDTMKIQLATNEVHCDWLRTKVNQLEMERAQLIRQVYKLELPVPELVKTPNRDDRFRLTNFEDIGDVRAKELGLPTFDN